MLCSLRSQKTGPASWHMRKLGCWAFTQKILAAAASGRSGEKKYSWGGALCKWPVWCAGVTAPVGMRVCWPHCCHLCPQAAAELRTFCLGFRILVFSEVCGFGFCLLFFPLGYNCDSEVTWGLWKNAFIGQCLIRSCCTATGCSQQPRHGVTCDTCGWCADCSHLLLVLSLGVWRD